MQSIKKATSIILVFVLIFTALPLPFSRNTGTIQAYAEEMTDEQAVQEDVIQLQALAEKEGWLNTEAVTADAITLPIKGINGSDISWSSSEEEIITTAGAVRRPSEAQGDKVINLTATLSRGEHVGTRVFTVTVAALTPEEEEAFLQADADWIYEKVFSGFFLDNIELSLNLPIIGPNGSAISWASSKPEVISPSGSVYRPEFSLYMGHAPVTLTATVSRQESVERVYMVDVKPLHPTDKDRVAYYKTEILTDQYILRENSPDSIRTDLNMPTTSGSYYYVDMSIGGCTIAWDSSHPDVITTDGVVTRPPKGQSSVTVTLTATISYGEEFDVKTFHYVVTPMGEYPLAINYENFINTKRLQFNGKSGTIDTTDQNGNPTAALQFHNGTETIGGSVFTKNKVRLGDNLSFSTVFTFRINNLTDYYNLVKSGAFTFTLQAADNTACAGSLNEPSLKPGLSIAFVTNRYKSDGGSQGENHNYIEILTKAFYNGDYNSGTDMFSIESTRANMPMEYYTVWIEYDGTEKVLEIWYATSGERPVYNYRHLREENVDLGEILTSAGEGLAIDDVREVYAGFMGSIGDAQEEIEIYDWSFKNNSTPINRRIYDFYDVSDVTLSYVPAGVLQSTLTATVSGVNGPMAGIPVEFYTDFGSLDQSVVLTDESGNAIVTLSAEHTGVANVKVIAEGGAMTEAETPLAANDEDSVDFDIAWLNGAGLNLLLDGNSLDNVITTLNLPPKGSNGSTISWGSNNTHVNVVDGNVTPPTPEEGNQQVTLTATLIKGSVTKTESIVVTIKVPDSTAVPADSVWLTDTMIFNGNIDWHNVTDNLNLPTDGKYGSSILWTSSNQDSIALNGVVIRPSYTQGDQTVGLTAKISKGLVSITKEYTVTVKALDPTDLESVNVDYDWLTWDIIKNGHSDPNKITGNLNLPLKGLKETIISWVSSNTDFVETNGLVNQPAFSQGTKKITLTATVSRGTENVQKTFEITILILPQTDAEAVAADINWLDISKTLGQNLSEFSIKEKLELPSSAFNKSEITWTSDAPTFISDIGEVSRPDYTEGHKVVTLTAVLRKGTVEESKTFTYTVMAFPDETPPKIIDMLVTRNGTRLKTYSYPFDTTPELPWDTTRIYINFDEELFLNYEAPRDGRVDFIGPDGRGYGGILWEDSIIIDSTRPLKPGATYELVIPFQYMGDKYGNYPVEDIRIPVRVEPKPDRTIQVVSSTPNDREKDVDRTLSQISFKFNYSDIVAGDNFSDIQVQGDKGGTFRFPSLGLSGDTVTFNLRHRLSDDETVLYSGEVFTIVIPAGAVTDRYANQNKAQTIQFRAKRSVDTPKIASVYPQDGQTDIDIHQSVDVVFDDSINSWYNRLSLRDENWGSVYFTSRNSLEGDKRKVSLVPYQPLKPNTVYILYGPHDWVDNPSQLEFKVSFKTGDNKLGIKHISPEDEEKDIPINRAVEIEFSGPITKGPAFANIEFKDLKGSPVAFHAEEIGNKAILTPDSDFNEEEIYFVHIPKDAYKGQGDITNDDYKFSFSTDKKLETVSNMLDVPFKGLVGRTVQLSADRLERFIQSAKHEIISYEWDFADGSYSTEKNSEHIYNQIGNYLIKLKVRDNKGFSYELEKEISIVPIQNVQMSVTRNGSNNLFVSSGWRIPTLTYNIRLECENIPLLGETVGVQLYKNGILQKTYEKITSDSKNAYTFTYEPEKGHLGNYELVFTYTYAAETITVRERLVVTRNGSFSFLRFQLYDKREGEIYHEAEYLNVKVDGVKKVAVREWIASLNEYVYTVQEQFPILRYYKFYIEGFSEDDYGVLYNNGNIGDFHSRPPVKRGYPMWANIFIPGYQDIFLNYYIEGVDVGPKTFTVNGTWQGLDPGYFELKSSSGKLHLTSSTGKFEFRPGKDLRAGDSLMIRTVSKNGIIGEWISYPIQVLPKPTIMGSEASVRYVDGRYELSLGAPFTEIMGGGIPLLDDIPFLDGGNFGIGGGLPSFNGIIYKQSSTPKAEMDFNGEASYSHKNKTSTPFKGKKHIKKVKTIGFEVEIEMAGYLTLEYDRNSNEWKTEYLVINVDGYGGKYWSTGYKIAGVIGIEGKLELGAYVGGTLKIDRTEGSAREYSGIIRFSPGVTASVTGSYGLGEVVGYVSAFIPAEVHIPTGYVEAEVDVNARVTASFLTYSTTLYDKQLLTAHWDNGKEKVVYRRLGFAELAPEEKQVVTSSGLKLMNRNYLNRESVLLGGNESTNSMFKAEAGASTRSFSLLAGGNSGPQTDVLWKNIYPKAEIQLVQNGGEPWLIWTDDNPERDAVNRTQLRYSVLNNGTWSAPMWLDDDKTADFSPVTASVENGMLMAWQNISKHISEGEGLSGMLSNSEISVTTGAAFEYGGYPKTVTLTDDNKLDHSPRLAADGNNALLVWTKSEGLAFTHGADMTDLIAPGNSDSLYFSVWDGSSSWSDPAEIQGSMPSILETNLTMRGNEGLLLYTLDMDNDMSTSEDREVFARLFDENTWEEAIRLTNNRLNNLNPRAAYIEGNWFITWVQDGNILYKEGLDGETKTLQLQDSVANDYQLTVMEGEYPQVALVYKKSGGDFAQGLYASFYDVDKGLWSAEILLSEGEGYINYFKPLFTGDGKLTVAYSQAEIITEIVPVEIEGVQQLVEKQNVSDKVDLKVLTYIPGHDLAFNEEDGLQLSSGLLLPGTVITVFVPAMNQGDFAENAVIELYDGNPTAGGRLIASSEQIIPARSSVDVEIDWLVPSEERDEYNLHAVIRPLGSITEKDGSNNTINLNIKTANVYVTDLTCENLAKDDYLLSAVIINDGGKVLNDIGVKLEHIESGEILKSEFIKRLEPGQEFPISILFSAKDHEKDGDGKISMVLTAVLPEAVSEQSTDDNVGEFTLEPASILVNSMAPGPDETQVPVGTAITLSLNKAISEGAGFDKIILEDEYLDIVEITRALDGDTLVVTPLSPLANNTKYTLTVPTNAFGNDYGHTLEEAYTMSFTTTSTNPEVTFSYPGYQMGETALDTDIRLKFNQNVSEGPTYTDITMYGENGAKVPALASIQGEWLDIKPVGGLRSNTSYSLVVPGGAVRNDDKTLQEDYRLEFTTVSTGSSDNNNNNNNNNKGDSDQTKSYNANIGAIGNMQNGQLPVTVNSNTGRASIDLGKLAEEIFVGDENIVISVPSIPEVDTYTLEMPAASLSDYNGNGTLAFETHVGSLLIRPGMLSGMPELNGKTAGITIAAEDKTKLSDESRDAIGDHPLIQLTLTLDGKQTEWNNPSAPVRVSIPYKPTAEELANPESIIIWYIDGSGRAVSVPNGRYDLISGTVTFLTTHFSHYVVAYYPVRFKDVVAGEWYKKAVDFIAARQITSGTGNGNFSPKTKITRGEFITLLMRAYEIAPDSNPTDNFEDGGNTYYTGYLAAAKRLEISHGVGNNLFAPGKEITRQEMFTMLYNALKVIDRLPQGNSGKTLEDFTDVKEINLWAKESFTLFLETGTIVGSNGKLTPNGTAARAEMAQVLYNLLYK